SGHGNIAFDISTSYLHCIRFNNLRWDRGTQKLCPSHQLTLYAYVCGGVCWSACRRGEPRRPNAPAVRSSRVCATYDTNPAKDKSVVRHPRLVASNRVNQAQTAIYSKIKL